MIEISTLERVRNIISVINKWNPEKPPNEIAREMLTPKGCIYIKPGTISIENTAYAKKPVAKRAVLRIITEYLIKQNPPREK